MYKYSRFHPRRTVGGKSQEVTGLWWWLVVAMAEFPPSDTNPAQDCAKFSSILLINIQWTELNSKTMALEITGPE